MSPIVNGDSPHSATLRHLLTYPLIRDGVNIIQQHPLGRKSIDLGTAAYQNIAPILSYFAKPYGYVSPYVERADDLGDQTLGKVDERFPAVKKPVDELLAGAKEIVSAPIRLGQSSKQYVVTVWTHEYNKTGGQTYGAATKAAAGTAIALTTDALDIARELLGTGAGRVKTTANNAASSAADNVQAATN